MSYVINKDEQCLEGLYSVVKGRLVIICVQNVNDKRVNGQLTEQLDVRRRVDKVANDSHGRSANLFVTNGGMKITQSN